MGASAAVTRVLVMAMVRDLFEGEAMARVMSLVFMVFMLVPVLAPNIGQAILLVAPWRAIFLVLAGYAADHAGLVVVRLPETLHPEYRRTLDSREIAGAMPTTVPRAAVARLHAGADGQLRRRWSPTSASIQQIVFEVFDAPRLIGLVFARDRRADGARVLDQSRGRRPLRAAPGRP